MIDAATSRPQYNPAPSQPPSIHRTMTHQRQEDGNEDVLMGDRRTNNDDSSCFSVGIIGAGYAGLTLARYLDQTMPGSAFSCIHTVLEEKGEPIPIFGTIRLPHAKDVLQELQMYPSDICIGDGDSDNNSSCLVDRQKFLNLLRQRVSILYSSEIIKLEVNARKDIDDYKTIKRRILVDKRGLSHGPFDCVVFAGGFQRRGDLPSIAQQSHAILGDARWQHAVWFWNFGQRRIQRGGDIALCDARELAKEIAFFVAERRSKMTTDKNYYMEFVASDKFRPQRHIRWGLSKWTILIALAAIWIRIFCYHYLNNPSRQRLFHAN